jgi:hypothetical protein
MGAFESCKANIFLTKVKRWIFRGTLPDSSRRQRIPSGAKVHDLDVQLSVRAEARILQSIDFMASSVAFGTGFSAMLF